MKPFLNLDRKEILPKPPDKQSEKESIEIQSVKRSDRTVDKLEKSFFNNIVIKKRLNTILNDSDDIARINNVVKTINSISYNAHHLINLHILRLLDEKQPMPELDQTFFNHACLFSSKLGGKFMDPKNNQSMKITANIWRDTLPKDFLIPERNKLLLIVNFLVLQMKTEAYNHLNLNFPNRFAKYIKSVHNIKDIWKARYIVRNIFQGHSGYKSKFDNLLQCKLLIQIYGRKFRDVKCTENLVTDNLNILLPFYYQMLRVFEEAGIKTFSLMPQKGNLIPSHITISTSCLYDLASLWAETPTKNFKKLGHGIWNKTFDITQTKNKWFIGLITTNGYDVSVYYKKPPKYFKYKRAAWMGKMTIESKTKALREILNKRKAARELAKKKSKKLTQKKLPSIVKKDKNNIDIFNRWMANDPGHRFLFTVIDRDDIVIRCSAKEYKHLTGQKKRLKQINNRKDSLPILNSLTSYSFKTTSLKTFINNLTEVYKIYNEIIDEYIRLFYRKLKFHGYIKRQETYYILSKRLEQKGSRTVIGWGNGGSNQKGLKGGHMPNKSFYNHVNKNSDVHLMECDEYLSTKMCSKCGKETKTVKCWKYIEENDSEGVKKLRNIYGLRRCSNNECRITWDRDVNASRNILIVLLNQLKGDERPKYLCRKKRVMEPSDNMIRLKKLSKSE